MRDNQGDTPPSSINGDDIIGENDEIAYLGHLDELILDEDEGMEEVMEDEQEDEDEEIPEDHCSICFDKHERSVFCCDIHPVCNYAVTGGEDDIAYVWSTETGNVLLESEKFKDSVIFVGFSFDGEYVAAADMLGGIKVWQCKGNPPWPLVFEFEIFEINFGLWHFGARVLMFGTDTGDVHVFKIPSGEAKVLHCDHVKVKCGKMFPDGKRLAVGYSDGSIKIWDIKGENIMKNVLTGAEENGVGDLAIHPDNNLVASTAENGKISLILSNGKMVGQLQTDLNLECVAFSQDPTLGYLASGTLDGSLTIWDVARQMARSYCTCPEEGVGIIKLIWVKDEVLTVCLDGSIRIYNGKSGERQALLTGHRSEILDVCCNVQNNVFVTVADDGTARVYKYNFNK